MMRALLLVLLLLSMPLTAAAQIPQIRSIWTGTVLGHERPKCRSVEIFRGAPFAIDGARINCRGRVILFATDAADDVPGGVVTTGWLCRPGQWRHASRKCCPLTFVTVTGDFNFEYNGGYVETIDAGASCRRRIYPAGSISLRRVEILGCPECI